MAFQDRLEAGRVLGELVAKLPDLKDGVVLGLVRGGVPVAYEVARACGLPLDILVVRKLGVPGQEELAMGAIASGGGVVLNEYIVRSYHVSEKKLEHVIARETQEMERREKRVSRGPTCGGFYAAACHSCRRRAGNGGKHAGSDSCGKRAGGTGDNRRSGGGKEYVRGTGARG